MRKSPISSSLAGAPQLAELQRWLRWAITDPRGVAPALADPGPQNGDARRYPERYTEPGRRLLRFVEARPPLGAAERLEIYAEGYFARLAESLGDDFEAVRAVLGEAAFLKLVADYLKAHPSSSFNIGEVGENLPAFVRAHALGLETPWIADLARLEWAVIEAFYADELPRMDPESVASIPPEVWTGARFDLDPSVRVLRLPAGVRELWQARRDEKRLEACIESIGSAACGSKESLALLHRDTGGAVEVSPLDPRAASVLRAMGEGATLARICEQLEREAVGAAPSSEAGPPPMQQWFSEWISSGMIRWISGMDS